MSEEDLERELETANESPLTRTALRMRMSRDGLVRQARRYGPAELLGKAVGIPAAMYANYRTMQETGNPVLAVAAGGAAGTTVENFGFYSWMVLSDVVSGVREAHSNGRRYRARDLGRTLGHLIGEFGIPEMYDSLLSRPILVALGQNFIESPFLGTTMGMIAADFLFYGWPVFYREHIRPRMLPSREE